MDAGRVPDGANPQPPIGDVAAAQGAEGAAPAAAPPHQAPTPNPIEMPQNIPFGQFMTAVMMKVPNDDFPDQEAFVAHLKSADGGGFSDDDIALVLDARSRVPEEHRTPEGMKQIASESKGMSTFSRSGQNYYKQTVEFTLPGGQKLSGEFFTNVAVPNENELRQRLGSKAASGDMNGARAIDRELRNSEPRAKMAVMAMATQICQRMGAVNPTDTKISDLSSTVLATTRISIKGLSSRTATHITFYNAATGKRMGRLEPSTITRTNNVALKALEGLRSLDSSTGIPAFPREFGGISSFRGFLDFTPGLRNPLRPGRHLKPTLRQADTISPQRAHALLRQLQATSGRFKELKAKFAANQAKVQEKQQELEGLKAELTDAGEDAKAQIRGLIANLQNDPDLQKAIAEIEEMAVLEQDLAIGLTMLGVGSAELAGVRGEVPKADVNRPKDVRVAAENLKNSLFPEEERSGDIRGAMSAIAEFRGGSTLVAGTDKLASELSADGASIKLNLEEATRQLDALSGQEFGGEDGAENRTQVSNALTQLLQPAREQHDAITLQQGFKPRSTPGYTAPDTAEYQQWEANNTLLANAKAKFKTVDEQVRAATDGPFDARDRLIATAFGDEGGVDSVIPPAPPEAALVGPPIGGPAVWSTGHGNLDAASVFGVVCSGEANSVTTDDFPDGGADPYINMAALLWNSNPNTPEGVASELRTEDYNAHDYLFDLIGGNESPRLGKSGEGSVQKALADGRGMYDIFAHQDAIIDELVEGKVEELLGDEETLAKFTSEGEARRVLTAGFKVAYGNIVPRYLKEIASRLTPADSDLSTEEFIAQQKAATRGEDPAADGTAAPAEPAAAVAPANLPQMLLGQAVRLSTELNADGITLQQLNRIRTQAGLAAIESDNIPGDAIPNTQARLVAIARQEIDISQEGATAILGEWGEAGSELVSSTELNQIRLALGDDLYVGDADGLHNAITQTREQLEGIAAGGEQPAAEAEDELP